MGVVAKQSINNAIVTYIGFAIGAINTLFLSTQYLSTEENGVITYVIAASNLLWPLMALGFHNTIIKFFKKFEITNQHRQFFTWLLFITTLVMVVVFLLLYFNESSLQVFYKTNPRLKRCIYPIFLVGLSAAYFEIFHAWSKAHLRSVEGTFLKHLFSRICIFVLLILVYKKIITEEAFLYGYVIMSMIKALLMKIIAYRIEMPVLKLEALGYFKEIATYSFIILVAAMISVFLLELDKVMIERYMLVENVAIYSIMIYMASVIEVPLKSMMQITTPLTSNYLEENKMTELSMLNKSTSINTLTVAGVIALLVFCNAEVFYTVIPDQYILYVEVLFLLCFIKLIEASMGVTSAILYNSDYYKWLLLFGIVVAATAIMMNSWLIPIWGLRGAAVSSLIAYIVYDVIKIFWVKKCFDIHPFGKGFLKITIIILGIGILFRWISLQVAPTFASLILKSVLIVMLYGVLIYQFKVSETVNSFLESLLGKLKRKLS